MSGNVGNALVTYFSVSENWRSAALDSSIRSRGHALFTVLAVVVVVVLSSSTRWNTTTTTTTITIVLFFLPRPISDSDSLAWWSTAPHVTTTPNGTAYLPQ